MRNTIAIPKPYPVRSKELSLDQQDIFFITLARNSDEYD